MDNVSAILKEKGNEVYSVSPDTIVLDALNIMAREKIAFRTWLTLGMVFCMSQSKIL
jgi:CBS domain-containing protein